MCHIFLFKFYAKRIFIRTFFKNHKCYLIPNKETHRPDMFYYLHAGYNNILWLSGIVDMCFILPCLYSRYNL